MPQSTGRPAAYSRPASSTRPMPPVRSTASVAPSNRPIYSGSVNVVTVNSVRTRPVSQTRQPSMDRSNPSLHNSPSAISATQKRLTADHNRSRFSTHERSVTNDTNGYRQTTTGAVNSSSNDYPERRTSTTAPILSSHLQSILKNADEEPPMRKTSPVDSPPSSAISSLESKLIDGGLTGLQNLGNTCFMNSVLQCLSNTKPLLLFCFKENLSHDFNTSSTSVMKGVLMREYVALIRNMWSSSHGRAIASPSSFKNTIGRFAPRFLGYAQQDSQEFLRYLLQGLHEDVNRVQRKQTAMKIDEAAEEKMREIDRAKASWLRCLRYDDSPIADIFAGQLKSTLECSTCHYQSITFDMFWDLSIPLPRSKSSCNLDECIQLFMSKEELDGNEKPMCARCKEKRRCTKKFSIQKCPDILVLHLKRFSQMRSRAKLSTHVDFPMSNLQLDELSEVISESYAGPVPTYNLIGVSNHSGTAYSGHYIAQCKHPFSQEWHEFNDSSVYKLNDRSRMISSDAYVLFYERNK